MVRGIERGVPAEGFPAERDETSIATGLVLAIDVMRGSVTTSVTCKDSDLGARILRSGSGERRKVRTTTDDSGG